MLPARPIRALIDRNAIRHNLQRVAHFAPGAKRWAVIKANAYGHGVERILPALAAAEGLALLEIEVAIGLRKQGWSKPILLLEGPYAAADLAACVHWDFQVAIHSPHQFALLDGLAAGQGVHVWLKLNTGMHRLGFPAREAADWFNRLQAHRAVKSAHALTHFARADEANGAVDQTARFFDAVRDLPGERALANSAAIVDYAPIGGGWIRPGLLLYGASPLPAQSAAALGLLPAMTLATEIIGVQQVPQGEALGYGGLWRAPRLSKIAVLAAGYADGYPRAAPTGTPVLIAGQRVGLVGRVSMDKITVDITDCATASIGSRAILWGAGLPVEEIAEHAGTIAYELLTALHPRVGVEVTELTPSFP